MDGEIIYYDENGKPFDGNYVSYDDNGMIEIEVKCIKGKPEGECKSYSNGLVLMTSNYKNGKIEGETNFTDKNGNIYLTWVYKKGKFIKEIKVENKNYGQ
jgi:antitoxin component YwqK of YwqJK toxin-antitoxin module